MTWSAVLSVLTIGVLPGYDVQRKTLDANLAWPGGAPLAKIGHLQYQARTHRFF